MQIINRDRRLLFYKTISQKINMKREQHIIFTFHPENGIIKIVIFNGCMLIHSNIKEFMN
jgi:hypothetical protein